MNIQEIDRILSETPMQYLQAKLSEFSSDERTGVKKLLQKYQKKHDDYVRELERIDRMMLYERKYAGPVCAATVILPKDHPILYVNDSKQLSPKKREELYDVIARDAVSFGVSLSSEKVIDEINILQATYRAMREAVRALDPQPDLTLNDDVTIPELAIRQVPIIKGDAKSASIAAASILAKVTRDRLMVEYDRLYPEYGFAEHKGYGSQKHIEALKKYGPCPIHRETFIRGILA